MASSSGRVSRNSSEKMSSSIVGPVVPSRLALGLDAQQLLLVVPLVERLGLVEALVALQADQPGAGHLGHRLGQLGLARARRALDEDRLLQPVGEVHDAGDALVGQVVDLPQRLADRGDGLEAVRHRVRGYRPRLDQRGIRFSRANSAADLAVAVDDVLEGGELAQAHRARGRGASGW